MIVDPCNQVRAWFGFALTNDDTSPFLASGQRATIGELETVAVVLVLRVRAADPSGKHLISFVDNEVSKYSLRGTRTRQASPSCVALHGVVLHGPFEQQHQQHR